jgi:hypothetical protein
MRSHHETASIGFLFVPLVFGFGTSARARAQDRPCVPRSLEELAQLTYPELEQLYRAAPAGAIPCGYTCGRAIYCLDKPLNGIRSKVTRLVWHGKEFHDDGTLVNQWSGFKAIRARVCYGQGWLDGGPAIIMDYSGTSLVWHDVRDELREVAPGLYLGVMYRRRAAGPKFVTYFALEAQSNHD